MLRVLILTSLFVCILILYIATWGRTEGSVPRVVAGWAWKHVPRPLDDSSPDGGIAGEPYVGDTHPIARLMRRAEEDFAALLAGEAVSLEDAARKYRGRRGRHPPPGFDAWYAFARAKGAVVVEGFFDQVYQDLGPFWGVDVVELQRTVRGFRPKVSVRGGHVVPSGAEASYERVRDVVGILEELEKESVMLPDVDVPLNVNDEIAMLVPWKTMETAVEFARSFMPPAGDVVNGFSAVEEDTAESSTFDPEWLDNRMHHKAGGPFLGPRPLWSLVQPACSPGSATAKGEIMADIWHPQGHTKIEHSAAALMPLDLPANSTEGYVTNWTVASDICGSPELQGLHGSFVAPKSMSITEKLFPLFSASKMAASNEILIPMLSSFNASTPASVLPWAEKEEKLYWRGQASGGASSDFNWRRMQRHRFVSMLNATHVEIAEAMLHAGNESTVGLGYARNFRLLPANGYHLATQRGARMAEWVNGWADVGFTNLECDEFGEESICSYTDEFFSVDTRVDEAGSNYKYAAILDGDGGDDGGEFRQRLDEGRGVLRASVYKQWFDARLVPWLHFIPMANTFTDVYGIMEYFFGTAIVSGAATSFAHAHVEVEKHEHHFQTPHWDDDGGDGDSNDGRPGHHDTRSIIADGNDERAREIAREGHQWAERALRQEDVLVYVYRLILEYARVMDAKRHTMGWADDISS